MVIERLKCLFILAVFFVISTPSLAQILQSHAKWHWTCKKLSKNEYELIFHLQLKKGWHIFADADQHGIKKKKGNSFILPSFRYDKNSDVKLHGSTNSKGMLETKKIKHLGLVSIYNYKVLYIQRLSAKPGTKISGSYTYQVCNDEKKLAPVTESFSAVIK